MENITIEKAVKYDVLVNALFTEASLSWDKKGLDLTLPKSVLRGLEPEHYAKTLKALQEEEAQKCSE